MCSLYAEANLQPRFLLLYAEVSLRTQIPSALCRSPTPNSISSMEMWVSGPKFHILLTSSILQIILWHLNFEAQNTPVPLRQWGASMVVALVLALSLVDYVRRSFQYCFVLNTPPVSVRKKLPELLCTEHTTGQCAKKLPASLCTIHTMSQRSHPRNLFQSAISSTHAPSLSNITCFLDYPSQSPILIQDVCLKTHSRRMQEFKTVYSKMQFQAHMCLQTLPLEYHMLLKVSIPKSKFNPECAFEFSLTKDASFRNYPFQFAVSITIVRLNTQSIMTLPIPKCNVEHARLFEYTHWKNQCPCIYLFLNAISITNAHLNTHYKRF